MTICENAVNITMDQVVKTDDTINDVFSFYSGNSVITVLNHIEHRGARPKIEWDIFVEMVAFDITAGTNTYHLTVTYTHVIRISQGRIRPHKSTSLYIRYVIDVRQSESVFQLICHNYQFFCFIISVFMAAAPLITLLPQKSLMAVASAMDMATSMS